MRVNVSLNEDSAQFEHKLQHPQQQPQQYCHDPYAQSANQLYSSSSPISLLAAAQHIVPAPQQETMSLCRSYSSSQESNHHLTPPNMVQAPHSQYQYQGDQGTPCGASYQSSSFYGGSDDEVQSTHSSMDNNMAFTVSKSLSSCCSDVAAKKLRPMGTPVDHRGHVDPSRFKTEPCTYYARGEECPYTPQCAFAHGETDKRSRRRNVREGVAKVNTLPRTLVHHEAWVQTTKYTRKTGPSTCGPAGFMPSASSAPIAVPAPSFAKKAH